MRKQFPVFRGYGQFSTKYPEIKFFTGRISFHQVKFSRRLRGPPSPHGYAFVRRAGDKYRLIFAGKRVGQLVSVYEKSPFFAFWGFD